MKKIIALVIITAALFVIAFQLRTPKNNYIVISEMETDPVEELIPISFLEDNPGKGLAQIVEAAEGDISLGVLGKIPADKVEKARKGTLKLYPVPLDREGNPVMGESKWIIKIWRQHLKSLIIKGLKRIHEEDPAHIFVPDQEVIVEE